MRPNPAAHGNGVRRLMSNHLQLTCPKCSTRLNVAAPGGETGRAKCGGCGHTFVFRVPKRPTAPVQAVAPLAETVSAASDPFWTVAILILPLLLAIHTILMTARPKHLDSFLVVGAMMGISALFLLPLAYATNAPADDTPAIKLTVLTVQGGG